MTREEIGEMVAALPQGLDADEFIYKLVNWAVDREREACAKLLENGRFLHDEAPAKILAKEAAKAIRARGEK